MKRFEILDHTADIGIVAWGRNLPELFSNAAEGMFSLITDAKVSGEGFETEIAVEGEDRVELLVNWLNELLYVFETEEVLPGDFEIKRIGPVSMKGRVRGGPIDYTHHELKREIKACTYYQAAVEELGPTLWRAQVYFDM